MHITVSLQYTESINRFSRQTLEMTSICYSFTCQVWTTRVLLSRMKLNWSLDSGVNQQLQSLVRQSVPSPESWEDFETYISARTSLGAAPPPGNKHVCLCVCGREREREKSTRVLFKVSEQQDPGIVSTRRLKTQNKESPKKCCFAWISFFLIMPIE